MEVEPKIDNISYMFSLRILFVFNLQSYFYFTYAESIKSCYKSVVYKANDKVWFTIISLFFFIFIKIQ